MLKLLLDEHISPQVAAGVLRRDGKLVVHTLQNWESGGFPGQSDAACLQEAARQSLTLVTYDRRTIPPLLKAWGEEGRPHGGIIFVDEKTISPSEIGRLIESLLMLVEQGRHWNWKNRICFLHR